ncbi:MAG: ABC transporter ATP-binding protein, partial [Alphaproteobacteria bacterium]
MTLLRLEQISLHLGDRMLFEDLTLTVSAGDRLALVGRNGVGKSTLLSLLAGEIEADAGSSWRHPRRRFFRLPQDPLRPAGLTAAAFLAEGWDAGIAGDERRAEPHEVERLLAEIGSDGDARLETLSGGAWRRLALGRALLAEADLLLLDEPTNHLDLAAIRWLEERLAADRRALVVISHDRAFLARVTDACLWLEAGRIHRLSCGITELPAHVEEVRREEAERLEKLGRRIAAETRWAREGITARRKRNQGRLRRLERLREARGRLLARREGTLALDPPGAARKGAQLVIEAENVVKRHRGRAIIDGFSTRIMRGERIGIVGANGAGKTTLVRLLAGLDEPDEGRVRRAEGMRLLYFGQMRATLDPERTLVETITDGTHTHVR